MTEVVDIDTEIHGGCRPDDGDIASLAIRQHGVVARRQLIALGFGRGAVDHRVAIGRLHPLHHGVYAVGHPRISARGRWMAAVLASGPRARLSHKSAAALWDLLPGASSRIHVTAPGRSRRTRPGITLHQVRELTAADRTMRDAIPVTTIARTLLDLADVVNARLLSRAIEQTERLQLLDMRAINDVLKRGRGRRGLGVLRRLLADHAGVASETRSELERRFLDLCLAAELPTPAVNVRLAGFEVDAVWSRQHLVVELDGYAFHHTRAAFERDRARDTALQLAGYRVLRLTAARLEKEPEAIIAAIHALLTR